MSSVIAQELPELPELSETPIIDSVNGDKPIVLSNDLKLASDLFDPQSGYDEDIWRNNILMFLNNDFNNSSINLSANNLMYF